MIPSRSLKTLKMLFLASGRIVMGLFGNTVPKTAGMLCYSIMNYMLEMYI